MNDWQLVGGRDALGKAVAGLLKDAAEQRYLEILDEVFAAGKAVSSSDKK
jgi:hypothetical protein